MLKEKNKLTSILKFFLITITVAVSSVVIAKGENVAKIGDTEYSTLSEAISAVQDNDTITILKDIDDAAGISVNTKKTFTIDFDGHTYTASLPGAGSKGTQTQMFQLLKGQTITFKNGTLRCAESNLTASSDPNKKNIKRIIQNYSQLTLENMTIDGTNLFGDGSYVMSFNSDPVKILGNTSVILIDKSKVAFDASGNWSNYPRCDVTVDTTGVIDGLIELEEGILKIKNVKAGGVNISNPTATDINSRLSIEGGKFKNDPGSTYLASGYSVIEVNDQDGYNYSVVPDNVKNVYDAINLISNPVTIDDSQTISTARASYDALTTDDQKDLVSNYPTLVDAENTLKALDVVNKINLISNPVTTDDSSAISTARASYDALTNDQKALVSNYQTLVDAESTLVQLIMSDNSDNNDKTDEVVTDEEANNENLNNFVEKQKPIQNEISFSSSELGGVSLKVDIPNALLSQFGSDAKLSVGASNSADLSSLPIPNDNLKNNLENSKNVVVLNFDLKDANGNPIDTSNFKEPITMSLDLSDWEEPNNFKIWCITNGDVEKIDSWVEGKTGYFKLYHFSDYIAASVKDEEETENKVDTSSWGKLKINNGIENWVDDSEGGKTSAMIMGPGITWLKEESDGTYAWYGIENPLKEDGTYVFENGSRFWVKWINQNNSEWNYYYNQLDEEHKRKVEDNNLWIFLVGVTAPDGTEYTNLGATVPFYVELGQDWDVNDINAVFIANNSDEKIYYSFKNLDFPAGNGTFARLELKHFSPYAIYDSLTLEEQNKNSNNFEVLSLSNSASSNSNSIKSGGYTNYKTGENCNLECVTISMILSLFALTYFNKKKVI